MERETDGRAAKSACIRLVYRFQARLSSGRKLRGRRAISLKRDASCVILNRNDKCNRRAGAKAPDARGITGERETVMRKKRGWRRAAALALSAVLLAGTATPCSLITLYNHNKICCAVVLLLGWGSVLFGFIAKLFFFQKTKAACVAVYIIAGAVMLSCSLAVIDEINIRALLLLVLGCAVYLFGSIFCAVGRKHPWFHVPFHMFMVAGSMIHAYVMYEYIFAAA